MIRNRFLVWRGVCCALAAVLAAESSQSSYGQALLLKDGRRLEGIYAECVSVAEDPLNPKATAGEVDVTPLLVVDDGLRRTYIHSFQVASVDQDNSNRDLRINVWQSVAERGGGVGRIGRALRVTPFDQYGRRIYEMNSTEGNLAIVQGITQITPVYTKVEGLNGGQKPIVWDMRIATSSIPRDILSRILATAVPQDHLEDRLQVVRLYLQGDRYRDAREELEQIVKDFPQRKDLDQDVSQLRQLGARLILKEIQLRGASGQHQLAHELLNQFPTEGVSGETLEQVRELLGNYASREKRRGELVGKMNATVAKISDANGRKLAQDFANEIAKEVNEDAIGRLSSFERLADDEKLTPEQKVALAMSGWLVGTNQATDNFQLAVSLAHVRDKILQYLREPVAANRVPLSGELRDMEGVTVERVAQILKLMKPPIDASKEAQRGPGLFELTVPGLPGAGDGRYFVQLPPEYDPLRHYPTIVTLADGGVTPQQMIDFWAGPSGDGPGAQRGGQATRHGYITIAVDWQQPHQFSYDYSAREHQIVLGSLRDACRRFAIDPDRVYLTGHGIGGDAAWDLALAHPDIWAGVIPIVAVADRFCGRYAANARYVPWYVVAGELDGDKLRQNARELDRYMKPNADVTVVEYLGRGYEPFGDEIQRIFDWMGRRKRTIPKEIDCDSMRPWDNFFWWLEAEGLPEKSMVAPENWPPAKAARPTSLHSKRLEGNKINTKLQAGRTTIWLSPEMVDFSKRMEIEVNGRSLVPRDKIVHPDLDVLLEDARTRADREHPFWAKVTTGDKGER